MSVRSQLWRAVVGGASFLRSRLDRRRGYKVVWNRLSRTEALAKQHVLGSEKEEDVLATAIDTRCVLQKTVGLLPEDNVLEIGCGIGRVGQEVAPLCKFWVGCDFARNMLRLAQKRLAPFANVGLIEIAGYDLAAIADNFFEVVYCTVVFMHLEEWDRYSYVLDAYRILRPGGRIYIDNFSLCSDAGWATFENHRKIPPGERYCATSRSSTPQELQTYLARAGFRDISTWEDGTWIRCWAVK
jgi:ubiquinone/menaquinone biosynthesis C-methylase UbiE